MAFQRTKGTVDFYPDENSARLHVFSCFCRTAERYGFREVEAPALESMALLTAKSGSEVKEQIFTLDKRSSEELGLRFEYTAGLARMFIARQKELAKPVKWFSMGRMWRYEQPQAGRLREFYQFNAEIFGSASSLADAEVIRLAVSSLCSLGIKEKDILVKVNDRRLLEGLLQEFTPRIDDALRLIDKKGKLENNEFMQQLASLTDRPDELAQLLEQGIDALAERKINKPASEGLESLRSVLKSVHCAVFDLSTARGLAYYTGTVFEIYDKEQKYRALCGGGRYDTMLELFGGEKTPATGFGMGYSPVLLLLQDKKLLPAELRGPEYFVIPVTAEQQAPALELVQKLRQRHCVDYDLNSRNISNQLRYANSLRAQKVLFLGPEEHAAGKVKCKELATGKEELLDMEKLI